MRVVQTLMAAQVITGRNGNGNGSAEAPRREPATDDEGVSETDVAPVTAQLAQPNRPAIPVRKG